MTSDRSRMLRVSRGRLCPICGKPDWCLIREDGSAAICARIESGKRAGEAGWLHRLNDEPRSGTRRGVRLEMGYDGRTDFAELARSYTNLVDEPRLERFAARLGLHPETLRRFSCGWSPGHSSWSFPMWDSNGLVTGVHLRKPDGSKRSVKGSKLGLFLPADLDAVETLHVCEGLSDTAALTELGFVAVGRASCSTGLKHLVGLVQRLTTRGVVIVADADEVGRRGAENLASTLVAYVRDGVRVIAPPDGIKDIRGWYCRGCTQADILRLVDAAPVRRLTITLRTRKVDIV